MDAFPSCSDGGTTKQTAATLDFDLGSLLPDSIALIALELRATVAGTLTNTASVSLAEQDWIPPTIRRRPPRRSRLTPTATVCRIRPTTASTRPTPTGQHRRGRPGRRL
jgi:hypothetical protein